MPHDYNQPFRNRLATGSYYMDPEEIDSILRIQWKSLHSGSPYVEDYYYLVSHISHIFTVPCHFDLASQTFNMLATDADTLSAVLQVV